MKKRYIKMNGKATAAAMLLAVSMLTAGCGAGSESTMSDAWAVEETAAARSANAVSKYAAGADSYGFDDALSAEAASADYSADNGSSAGSGLTADGAAPIDESDIDAAEASKQGRKLIKTVNISAQTTDFDAVTASIKNKAESAGGYIENSGIYGSTYYNGDGRYADYTIRIPSDRLDGFLDDALKEVNILSRNENVEDITLRYTDLESKVNALNTEQERLTELMAEADSVDAVIAIETRLSEVRYELESIKSSLKVYDNQVDYSTVYLSLREVKVTSAVGEASFADKISSGFRSNMLGLCQFAENAVIFVITGLPVFIVLLIPVGIIVWLVRRLIRRVKRRKTAKSKENADEKANKSDK